MQALLLIPLLLWFYTVDFTSVVPRPAASALPGNLCRKCRFLYPTPYLGVCMLSCFIPVQLFAIIWSIVCQPSLSMGFSRQEYWSGVAVPSFAGSSQPRDRTRVSYVSCIGRRVLYHRATWEASSQTYWIKLLLCGPGVLCFNKMIHMPLILENHCLLTSLLENNWE